MADQCQTTKSVPRDVPVSSGLAIAVLSVLAATGIHFRGGRAERGALRPVLQQDRQLAGSLVGLERRGQHGQGHQGFVAEGADGAHARIQVLRDRRIDLVEA